jgi:hypothetical protein
MTCQFSYWSDHVIHELKMVPKSLFEHFCGVSSQMSVPPELKIEQTRGSYAGATQWHRHLFSSDYLGNKL